MPLISIDDAACCCIIQTSPTHFRLEQLPENMLELENTAAFNAKYPTINHGKNTSPYKTRSCI
jgi:hypothetical protein